MLLGRVIFLVMPLLYPHRVVVFKLSSRPPDWLTGAKPQAERPEPVLGVFLFDETISPKGIDYQRHNCNHDANEK
jgi:hypothetical protein